MRTHAVVGVLVGIMLLVQTGALRGDPGKEAEHEKIARLIKQLGDDAFVQREAASKELNAIGEPALAELRKAAAASDDLEIRQRAKRAVEAITARRAASEIAKWQGTWKVDPDGTTMIIQEENWMWIYPGDNVAGSGTLKVVEVGKEMTKVEYFHRSGHPSTKVILRLRDKETLQYNGSYDDYPMEFGKGIHARDCQRIAK
jgi:hypothetical protein